MPSLQRKGSIITPALYHTKSKTSGETKISWKVFKATPTQELFKECDEEASSGMHTTPLQQLTNVYMFILQFLNPSQSQSLSQSPPLSFPIICVFSGPFFLPCLYFRTDTVFSPPLFPYFAPLSASCLCHSALLPFRLPSILPLQLPHPTPLSLFLPPLRCPPFRPSDTDR